MTTIRTTVGLARLVDQRVRELQDGYLAVPSKPRAVADLAELRRAASAAPGAVPAVWDLTAVPWVDAADPRVGDDPTAEESASHTAMTLYAIHQQSRSTRMHATAVEGRGANSLGTAVARLVEAQGRKASRDGQAADRISSTRRRFNALVTASTMTELVHHLRGLIHQLNQQEISLDYGRLAGDLVDLDDPRRADRVRLRWARDLVWATRRRADEAAQPVGDEPGPPGPGGSPGSVPLSGQSAPALPDHDFEETW